MNQQVIGSQYLFRGRVIKLRLDQVRLANQHVINAEIVEHGGAAAVVALDSENRVLLVHQYRFGAGKILFEIPAGTLEHAEDPALCATRELKEETGYSALHLDDLGYFYSSPGFSTEKIHLFLARSLTAGEIAPDENEDIHIHRVPLDEAVARIESGEIIDGKTVVGLLRVWKMLKG